MPLAGPAVSTPQRHRTVRKSGPLRIAACAAIVGIWGGNLTAAARGLPTLETSRQGRLSKQSLGFCGEALRPGQADLSWRETLKALTEGRRPATIPEFPCFVSPTANLADWSAEEGYQLLISKGFRTQVMLDALSRGFKEVISRDDRLGDQRFQNLAWTGGYLSEATLLSYRRTGDERFLDLFTTYFEQVLQRRDAAVGRVDAHRNRIMHGWGSIKADGKRWINLVTHNGRITYPATEFARIITGNPNLKRYLPAAEYFTAISRAALDEFDSEWTPINGDGGESWFLRPPTNNPEATNRIHLVGRSWINLAALSGAPKYRERVNQLIAIFIKGVQYEADGEAHWKYYPYFTSQERSPHPMQQENSEPVWKGTLTVPFLLMADRNGYNVPPQLLAGIAKTLSNTVLGEKDVMRNLHKKDSRPISSSADKDKIGMLQTLSGILVYGDVEPSIPRKLSHLVATRRDLFPGGWLGSPSGMMGYAFFLEPGQ